MKRGDIFTFTAPNGAEVTAIAIEQCGMSYERIFGLKIVVTWLCYGQNRLFTYCEVHRNTQDNIDKVKGTEGADTINYEFGHIVVDYAILPDYDEFLERHNDIEVAQAET